MNRKIGLIAGAVFVVAVFLLGFVPQYMKVRALDNQLSVAREQLNSERGKSQMDQLGLLCGRIYLETNLKNYGLASQYSTEFFNGVQTMMSQPSDSNRQSFLQKTLAQRNAVSGGLAQGNPDALPAIQNLFEHTLEVAGNGTK